MEIVFYRNINKPDYYLLYKGKDGVNAGKMLRKLTNTGEFEDSGFDKVDVELAYCFKTELNGEFFDFITEAISSNHIEHPYYNNDGFKAWYEFKNYEPDKWVRNFQESYQSKLQEILKSTQEGIQTSLF